MKNNDIMNVNPVENYVAPRIPTLDDTRDNAEMLKKLPNRWKKKAAVIACLGIMGATVISASGCGISNDTNHIADYGNRFYNPRNDHRLHHGGAGRMPMYVVHLTEQEALGIIREQLEAVGLNFDVEPPDYTVEVGGWRLGNQTVGLDLFDSERSVAVAHIFGWGDFTEAAAEAFAEQTNDITVGVFQSGTINKWESATNYEFAEARETIESQLAAQVREFIDFLRNEGII